LMVLTGGKDSAGPTYRLPQAHPKA
jgi:hypothetical protein